jgi:hypothetical protein
MATLYLTPKRFAQGGFGIDTSFLTAPAIKNSLVRATTMVNTWCNAPQVPQPFDFRGGTVTDEIHQFPIPSPLVAYPGSRRVFVYQRPLRTVTSFAIQFTHNQTLGAGYEIDLNVATDIFVNTTEGWCEIVASQPTIIGFPPIGYWYGLYQPQARLSYTYGYRNIITDDECEAASQTLFYATYGQWDPAVAPVVKIDGTTKTPTSDYTTNAADGSITFSTAPAPGTTVTATYTVTLPDAVAQATGIIATDLIGKARNTQRMPGLSSLKVAEVAMERQITAHGRYITQNGISIPEDAAILLGQFARGTAA